MTTLHSLYHKFTKHYPDYHFGYRANDLCIRLSVMRGSRAKIATVSLLDDETALKRQWYTLLKELSPNADKASPRSEETVRRVSEADITQAAPVLPEVRQPELPPSEPHYQQTLLSDEVRPA